MAKVPATTTDVQAAVAGNENAVVLLLKRILAEVEEDGDIPVLVTWDRDFRNHIAPHTCIRLESPVECWEAFNIPRGTPPVWTPAPGHPLANETWWRWE